jgi:hypothetical protein
VHKTLTAVACLALAGLCSTPAAAWGKRCHQVIDRVAVMALPEDGPVFLKRHVDYIAANATEPDNWRNASEPFSKIAEDPNHGWFRQQFAFMRVIPRSRFEFILALKDEHDRLVAKGDVETASRTNVRWTGTLPYAVVEGYGRLVACFRQVRKLQAKGNPSLIEPTCAFHVAWLGHYVGDGAQPMHVTWHSNGWRGPNPNGYTLDGDIHGRFETRFANAIDLKPTDVDGRLGAIDHQQADLFDQVLAFLDASGRDAEAVYRMDARNAFADPNDAEAREYTYVHVANGARFLRDLIQRAWIESAAAPANLPNPNESSAPHYNTATGSTPG